MSKEEDSEERMTRKGGKMHEIFIYAARAQHRKRKTGTRRMQPFSLPQIVKIRVTIKSSLMRSKVPN